MEKTIPDVFPETAPGSFLFVPEMGRYVCSSFHPYQWDLNYANPAVFNDMRRTCCFWPTGAST